MADVLHVRLATIFTDLAAALAACTVDDDELRFQGSDTWSGNFTLPAINRFLLSCEAGTNPIITAAIGATLTVPAGTTDLAISGNSATSRIQINNSGAAGIGIYLNDATPGLTLYRTALDAAYPVFSLFAGAGLECGMLFCSSTSHGTATFTGRNWAIDGVRAYGCELTCDEDLLKAGTWSGAIQRCLIRTAGGGILSRPYGISQTYNGFIRWANNLILTSMTASAFPQLQIFDSPAPGITYEFIGNTCVGQNLWVKANIPLINIVAAEANWSDIIVEGCIITGYAQSIYADAGVGDFSPNYCDMWDNPLDTTPGGYGPHTAVGPNDINPPEDPEFVDAGAGDYRLKSTSPCSGAWIAYSGLTEDFAGDPRPAAGTTRYDIGCYNSDIEGPYVTTAVFESATSILVTFNEAVTGGSLLVAAAWEISLADWISDLPTITGVTKPAATQARLALSGDVTPGGFYFVVAPDDVTDAGGNVIDPTRRVAECVYLTYGNPPAEEGVLEALTGAIGGEVASLIGTPVTRLAAPLTPSATTARVESTLHMPVTGDVWIEGERIAYASRTEHYLIGMTRETVIDPADSVAKPFRFTTLQAGTPVRLATRGYSLKDQARNDMFVRTSTGDTLIATAENKFYPRPLGQMEDLDLQDYVCRRYYQASGPRGSVFEVLEAVFRWASITGDDGTVTIANTLEITTAGAVSKLHDRYIYIEDVLCRVAKAVTAGGGRVTLYLETADGPFWRGYTAAPGGTAISYRLLPFRLLCKVLGTSGAYKAANLWIYLYVAWSNPASYLCADGTADTPADGRPIGAQAVADASIARDEVITPPPHSANRQPLYLINPYAEFTTRLVEDIVPAGTLVKVVSMLP